jgi:hypothetical protein
MEENKTKTIYKALRIINTWKFRYRCNRDEPHRSMLYTPDGKKKMIIDDRLFWGLFELYHPSLEIHARDGLNMNC